jgi:crotonobetainyl-CoA:carnitine CoA-transferase CaiB-like acyl-CoA transferase
MLGGPLDGILVLEVANFITGPYAAQLLADLGAETLKIEHLDGGDPFRAWDEGLYSPQFAAYNRNKRSLGLNLKDARGVAIFNQLAAEADVVIQNFRPGVADRLGIGYERVRQLNDRIIYCSISGLGASGPYAHRPSYDTVGQGLSGMLSLLLDPSNPQPVGPAFSDSLTGMFAAYGVLAALFARERTGKGQLVETNMLEATAAFLAEPYAHYFQLNQIPDSYYRPRIAQVYAFGCADGVALAIHLSSPPKFWEALVAVVGHPAALADPLLLSRQIRVDRYDDIRDALSPIFLTKTRDEWLRLLDAADVPCTPIYTLDQVLKDPQVRHLGLEKVMQHPVHGTVRTIGTPVHFSETMVDEPTAPPALAEHSDVVLGRLGYSADEIDQLRADEVIR